MNLDLKIYSLKDRWTISFMVIANRGLDHHFEFEIANAIADSNFPSSPQAYHMCNSEDLRLFCNGYYAEIIIMDPFSLEILFTLSSKVNPDWISALHVSVIIPNVQQEKPTPVLQQVLCKENHYRLNL